MAKQKTSVLDRIRESMKKKAEDAASFSNERELKLELDKTYIFRILPPQDEDSDDPFYATHSYHYMQFPSGGRYVFSKKMYGDKKDPIDEAVSEWYDTAEKTGDEDIKKIASATKRKRQYFMEVLLLKEDGNDVPDDKKYRVLIDTSNDGKLVKKLCVLMGLPFFKDIEDKWVDKTTNNIDPDKEYIDLIDMEVGHDIKVKKVKDGVNSWDINFDITPLKKQGPRPLSDDELELIKDRIDLKTYVKYIDSYTEVENLLNKFLNGVETAEEEEDPKPAKSSKKVDVDEEEDPKPKKTKKVEVEEEEEEDPKPAKKSDKKPAPKKQSEGEEEDWDELLNELDEE